MRKRGVTSQNFYHAVRHRLPRHRASFEGPAPAGDDARLRDGARFVIAALGYLVAKLLFWNQFELGLAPILIGFFFISSVQLFFVGIVGEYIGSIWTQVRHHPHVFEKERLNF